MGWYGTDFDGTLAYHSGGDTNELGEPIPLMLARVKQWLKEGKEVRIVTARACFPFMILQVNAWCKKHGLGNLKVTNQKDFQMIELWDDRAVQIIPNTGKRADGLP